MTDLYVHVEIHVGFKDDDYYAYDSKVYAIDPIGHKFLVVNDYGYFKWVDTGDCELIKEE